METRIQQSELPQNALAMTVRDRSWNGFLVETTEFTCAGHSLHPLPHEDRTRLSVVLEEVGGRCEPRLSKNRPCPIAHMPRHMAFIPAGMPMWGHSDDIRYVRDMTLCFDLAALEEQLGDRIATQQAFTPRQRFFDDRIWTMCRLLADACDDAAPAAQLYGDSLTAAVVALLLQAQSARSDAPKGLAPWQLRRAIDYMDAHLPQRIELRHLASLTALSQSHFSRAFKSSTGLAPYHWQLDARVRRAQALLLADTRTSLDQIAESTGFADAAHLGRTFRRLIGATPAAWRRDCKN